MSMCRPPSSSARPTVCCCPSRDVLVRSKCTWFGPAFCSSVGRNRSRTRCHHWAAARCHRTGRRPASSPGRRTRIARGRASPSRRCTARTGGWSSRSVSPIRRLAATDGAGVGPLSQPRYGPEGLPRHTIGSAVAARASAMAAQCRRLSCAVMLGRRGVLGTVGAGGEPASGGTRAWEASPGRPVRRGRTVRRETGRWLGEVMGHLVRQFAKSGRPERICAFRVPNVPRPALGLLHVRPRPQTPEDRSGIKKRRPPPAPCTRRVSRSRRRRPRRAAVRAGSRRRPGASARRPLCRSARTRR